MGSEEISLESFKDAGILYIPIPFYENQMVIHVYTGSDYGRDRHIDIETLDGVKLATLVYPWHTGVKFSKAVAPNGDGLSYLMSLPQWSRAMSAATEELDRRSRKSG